MIGSRLTCRAVSGCPHGNRLHSINRLFHNGRHAMSCPAPALKNIRCLTLSLRSMRRRSAHLGGVYVGENTSRPASVRAWCSTYPALSCSPRCRGGCRLEASGGRPPSPFQHGRPERVPRPPLGAALRGRAETTTQPMTCNQTARPRIAAAAGGARQRRGPRPTYRLHPAREGGPPPRPFLVHDGRVP